MFFKENLQFLNIRRQNVIITQTYADNFEKKADIFIKKKNFTPPITDLNNIIKYIYPLRISHDENLTEEKITTVIRRPKIYKTSGFNDILNSILQNIFKKIITPVIHLFRACITQKYH